MSADLPSHDEFERATPISETSDPGSAGDPRAISRRRLIKALVASGLVAAGSTLPGRWLSPAVEIGVLPAHAQISPTPTATSTSPPTPTSTPTPTPTPTPIPHTIVECDAGAVDRSGNVVYPWDSIWGYCRIDPVALGIQMRQTITLNQPNLPQQVLRVEPGATDLTGVFTPTDFDLGALDLNPVVDSWLAVLWEFVDPAVGMGSCENLLDIENPQ